MWSFITFGVDELASTTAYIGEVFTDVKLLFFVVIGIGLGLWVIGAIIKAIRPD